MSAPSPIDQDVGARLRAVRLRYALKQEQLAEVLGVTRATVTRWERGTRGLTVAQLVQIADQFGIPASQLLPERPDAPCAPAAAPDAPHAAAIRSIAQVLSEQPQLILAVMDFLERQTVS